MSGRSFAWPGYAGLACTFLVLCFVQIDKGWQSGWLAVDAGFFVFYTIIAWQGATDD
jgi:hypothetical protein